MAISASWYVQAGLQLASGNIALGTDTVKVALTSGYTPDRDVDTLWDPSGDGSTGPVASEIAGSGYPAGGFTLANDALTAVVDEGAVETDDYLSFDADDISTDPSTISATHAVVYVAGTAGTDDYLLGFVDFDATVSSTDGPFTITWHADGILTLPLQ